ncbi:MAG: hypothetical protein KatS3mg035_0582 [Bacteroidia bacterium]|nr:MAG: hypothetical protein KatS3mg035_0582 [Bacteroidia bacterium]
MKNMYRLSFYISICIFSLILMIQWIPFNFDFLDPLNQALEDFQLTDLVYKDFKEENQDTNIVFVNIGFLNRAEIAQQIENIAKYNPKVIGIDALFGTQKEPEVDSALSRVLQKYGNNIVMVNAFENYNPDRGKADSIARSMPYFSNYVTQGYSNLDDRTLLTIRNFRPFTPVKDTVLTAFAVEIVKKFDIQKVEVLKKRNNDFETINYKGNFDKFYAVIEAENALDTSLDLSFVKDKIVLFGYLNSDKNARDVTDQFFTPLNPKMAGRSLPDMYGIVVHANIIAMILSENYINVMSNFTSIFLAIILCYCNLLFLLYIHWKWNLYYDIIARIWQILQSIVIYFIIVWLFSVYRYETDLTLLIVTLALGPDVLEFFMAFYETWNKNHQINADS